MTHDEYTEKRLAILRSYLTIAAVSQSDGAEWSADLAKRLADALDRLALEIDPLANHWTKKGSPAVGESAKIR